MKTGEREKKNRMWKLGKKREDKWIFDFYKNNLCENKIEQNVKMKLEREDD